MTGKICGQVFLTDAPYALQAMLTEAPGARPAPRELLQSVFKAIPQKSTPLQIRLLILSDWKVDKVV